VKLFSHSPRASTRGHERVNITNRFNGNAIFDESTLYPKGVASQSPGLPLWATLGSSGRMNQPQRGCVGAWYPGLYFHVGFSWQRSTG